MTIDQGTQSLSVKPLDEHVDRVYRFALTLTGNADLAADLAQECMLRAHTRRHQIRSPRATLSWLFQITHNLWLDHCRGKQRHAHTSLESAIHADDARLASDRPGPDVDAIGREELRRVLASMDRLPHRQRTVLHLHTLEQLSIDEIGQLLNISRGAVKSSLSVARKSLRARLFSEETS